MEKLLREVPGVEYVYSISQPGMSMLIVRFYVGSKEEDAIVQTYNKLYSNFDQIPRVFHSRSSRSARSTTFPSWRSRYGARTMTLIT